MQRVQAVSTRVLVWQCDTIHISNDFWFVADSGRGEVSVPVPVLFVERGGCLCCQHRGPLLVAPHCGH